MSDTAVSLLTAPGTGAIATVEVRGPRAWELARELFIPAGKPLPESPEVNRFWFGTLGSDEVLLAVSVPLPSGRGSFQNIEARPEGSGPTAYTVEVHCHGGLRVVRWIIEQFTSHGCIETTRTLRPKGEGFALLQQAPTLRTASIILDQLNGAFANEVHRLLTLLETDPVEARGSLSRLSDLGHLVGRYLVEPWRIVVAGPPNVGKSSLVNALVGYQRSVVSEVAGTTRDAVGVRVAFEGWLVELLDTAGMRDASGLEALGIERAREALHTANRLVWVIDATDPRVYVPDLDDYLPTDDEPVVVANKCDLPAACEVGALPYFDGTVKAIAVSAKTGAGVAELARALVADIPNVPPGGVVPYTPRLIELVVSASRSAHFAKWDDAARLLREALAAIE